MKACRPGHRPQQTVPWILTRSKNKHNHHYCIFRSSFFFIITYEYYANWSPLLQNNEVARFQSHDKNLRFKTQRWIQSLQGRDLGLWKFTSTVLPALHWASSILHVKCITLTQQLCIYPLSASILRIKLGVERSDYISVRLGLWTIIAITYRSVRTVLCWVPHTNIIHMYLSTYI